MLFVAGALLITAIAGSVLVALGTLFFFGLLTYDTVAAHRASARGEVREDISIPQAETARVA
ncbi:MAG: hypothetical protein OEV43_06065 [Coriobacteriia bacterium]|nr:hypothetical protein [Coriobacteriia bacterium]